MSNKAVKVLVARSRKRQAIPFAGLQLFAEGGDDGGDDDGDDHDDDDDPDDDPDLGNEDTPLSFDDFLEQEGNQAEFDKRIREAVDTAVSSARKTWKSLTDDKVSEAEKLAKMTKDEKAEYLRQKEREEFEEEKAAFEREKLLVEVKKELQEQTLPVAFAESLVSIADAEKIKEAISDIKKTWDEEIAEAVKAKARQTTPPESGRIIGDGNRMVAIRDMASKSRIIKN